MEKEFYIKNMVCDRCIKVLKEALQSKNLKVEAIELGRVVIGSNNTEETRKTVAKACNENGFQLLDDPSDHLVERIKIELIELLKNLPLERRETLSEWLSEKLRMDYSKISKTFSNRENRTLEKYFIKLKIERVKELTQGKQYNFTEIADLLNYSNVNHLSRQFKSETGMTLSEYKEKKEKNRKPLDGIV